MLDLRDTRAKELGVRLEVGSVQESIDAGRVVEQKGKYASRNQLQTTTLLDTVEKHQFDALFGGGRRDEEKARAKERVFSFRDEFGQWDPKVQRPALSGTSTTAGSTVGRASGVPAVELDRARHLALHRPGAVELPSIYCAHTRSVFERNGILLANVDAANRPAADSASVSWLLD